jgi:AraC-like DNA-binding protein
MFKTFSPAASYSQFVERIWISKSRYNNGFAVSEYYPNGNADLLIELSQNSCKVLLFGAVTKKTYIQTDNRCEYLSVQFWPWQLNRLSGIHPKELVDQFVELDHIFDHSVDQIGIMLNNAETRIDKINVLYQILWQLTQDSSFDGSLGQSAIQQILKTSGIVRIKDLARFHSASVRRLETLIKNQTGLSPKFFARTTRLQKILKTIFEGIQDTLTDISYYFGFSDQSHFIHDFHELTGHIPTFFLNPNREDPRITYVPDIKYEPIGAHIFYHS